MKRACGQRLGSSGQLTKRGSCSYAAEKRPLGGPLHKKVSCLRHIVVVFRDVLWLALPWCAQWHCGIRVSRFKYDDPGGKPSCLVTLMVLDFGRVMYLYDFEAGVRSAGLGASDSESCVAPPGRVQWRPGRASRLPRGG